MVDRVTVLDETSSNQWLIPINTPDRLQRGDLLDIGDEQFVIAARRWINRLDGPYQLIIYVRPTKDGEYRGG